MKIEEIYIDGFGIFHDFNIKKLNPGLNILIGPNEAGKSTIHSFHKRILFGFPDRRSKLNLYPPLEGGNHGGRLIVSAGGNKRYVIERYSEGGKDVEVILPDGLIGGNVELSRLLGHANENIYNNIYAFGLTELQNFETLNSEEVRDRIYSAGTGVGSHSLSEIQKNIEKDAGDLFKLRGSSPEINSLFRDIKEIDSKLREIKNDVQKFDELHRSLENIDETIKNMEQERNQVRSDFTHVVNLITVWDDWRKIQESEDNLREIPEVEVFPDRGLELFDKHREKIDEVNDDISKNREDTEKIKIQKSQIQIDDKLVNNKDMIIELQKGEDKYLSSFKDISKEEEKLEQEKNELKQLLHEIGHDWDEEKLANFDVSIPAKETVRKKHSAIVQTEEQIRDYEKDVQGIEKNINGIKDNIKGLDKNIENQLLQQLDEKKLKQQRNALKILRAKYPSLKEKEADMRNLQEKEELFSLLKPQLTKVTSKLPIWPALMLIATGLISLLLLYFGNNLMMGIGIFSILSGSAIVYIVLTWKKLSAPISKKIDDKDTKDLVKTSEGLSAGREKLASDMQKIKDEMLSAAKQCEFEDIPDPQLVEDKDSEMQIAHENLLQLNELKKQREKLITDQEKLSEKANNLKNKLEDLKKGREQARKEWKDWLDGKGLESRLTPEGIIEIFATIKTCMEKKKSIEGLKTRNTRMNTFLNEYKEKISSVLEECNRTRKQKELNVLGELGKLSEDLKKFQEESNTLKQLDIDEKKFGLELKNLETKLAEQQGIISALLSKGSAKSENEFRENATNWEKRNTITKDTLQAEQNIKRISGDGKPYSDYINELKETTPEILKEQKSQLKEKRDELEGNLSNLREERGGINTEIKQIERREEGSSLRMGKNVKLQKLKRKSEEWSILILAKAIIRKAIAKYEKERQPGVIQESQSFFSKMTLGRYSRIYAPLDEPTKIYVEDKDGGKKDIQKLSKGTAEQLYLSLRFGFIREFGKKAESLPIIFDDILVNFDPKRFRAACKAIKELTETNQVVYFTCHPETVNLLTKTIPEARTIDLKI